MLKPSNSEGLWKYVSIDGRRYTIEDEKGNVIVDRIEGITNIKRLIKAHNSSIRKIKGA